MMTLKVSPLALERLKRTCGPKDFFRIRVDSGGCFGFQYIFAIENQKNDDDYALTFETVQILVDKISAPFLEGAELDYAQEMIGARFVVKNPRAESACGCKNSFSLK